MTDRLSLAVHAFASRVLILFSVDPIYQPLHSGRIWHKANF